MPLYVASTYLTSSFVSVSCGGKHLNVSVWLDPVESVGCTDQCLQTVAGSLCAVTDKVWTIKGAREGGTPFTTLAPLQVSNEASFTGTRYNFHTVTRVSGSVAHCLRLMGFDHLASPGWGGGLHGHPTSAWMSADFRLQLDQTNISTATFAISSGSRQ